MGNEETIVALATPPGIGALAIIRISGKESFKICKKIILEEEKFENSKDNKVHIYTIINKNKGEIIDEVTIIKYTKPRTYTGENLVEIIAHGGEYTVKKIISEINKKGARNAERGEFTKRAFLNGKMNLIKAEAIKNIIESQNERQYYKGISSYFKQEKKIKEWQEKIGNELTNIEAEIEFGDEEKIENKNKNEIAKIEKEIDEEIKRTKTIEDDYKGVDIIICGPSNAGKSSLFNFIIGHKRSIVNNKKGTTRDIISEKIRIKNKEVNLFDTAGIQETECEIEKEGIEKTKEIVRKKNIKIWISDISEKMTEEEKTWIKNIEKEKVLFILNKCDKKKEKEKEKYYENLKGEIVKVSIKERINSDIIHKKIEKIIKTNETNEIENYLFNQRQKKIAEKCKKEIKEAIKNWEQKEIVSFYLRRAIETFNELLGKNEDEKIINNIFNKFCIGK